MSDGTLPATPPAGEHPPLSDDESMPFDRDAALDEQLPQVLGGDFAYIGRGLTADEFTDYVRTYAFGTIPPDFVVLHHTGVPGIGPARAAKGWMWDAGDGGNAEQTYNSRLANCGKLKNDYQNNNGWDRGPHLFIDDRYIWLFSPMNSDGIHAKCGNYTYDSKRNFHYSIGIEVVGYYERVRWPEPVARLVGHAVAVLRRQLQTFELTYSYADGMRPGHATRNGLDVCAHPERVRWGGISSHRDYNKPWCPGSAISESYYIQVLQAGWGRLEQATNPPPVAEPVAFSPPPVVVPEPSDPSDLQTPTTVGTDMPIIGAESGEMDRAVRFIQVRLPPDSEYTNDVGKIIGYYWSIAPQVGVDPFLAAVQCIFETDGLRSQWAARPHRNPAGLGVHQEGGLSFDTWENAVRAHLGQLLAYALRDDEANDAQRAMMQLNPRFANIPPAHRGVAKTIAGLNGTWSANASYASRLISRLQAVLG